MHFNDFHGNVYLNAHIWKSQVLSDPRNNSIISNPSVFSGGLPSFSFFFVVVFIFLLIFLSALNVTELFEFFLCADLQPYCSYDNAVEAPGSYYSCDVAGLPLSAEIKLLITSVGRLIQ